VLHLTTASARDMRRLLDAAMTAARPGLGAGTPRVVAVLGVPNVGKSSLVNGLRSGSGTGGGVCTVGARPGVTRAVSVFRVAGSNGIVNVTFGTAQ
jgi:ribosome biogenesis GTPase A